MARIEIDHVGAGSPIPPNGFVADGTWETDTGTKPSSITCKLVRGAGPDIHATSTTITGGGSSGNWSADFPPLTPGDTLTLHAKFPEANSDEHGNLKVCTENGPCLVIEDLPELPPIPWDEAEEYKIKGKYRGGVGIVCLAVTIVEKKIKSIDATAAAKIDLKNQPGIWRAKLQLAPVGFGKKVTIVALLFNDNGMVLAKSVRRSKPRVG